MIGDTSANFDVLTLSEAELVDQACDRFETAWRSGDWPCIEGYLAAVAEPCRQTLLHELIKLELELRMKVGELPTAEEYRLRFPDWAYAIDEIIREVIEPAEVRSTLPDTGPDPLVVLRKVIDEEPAWPRERDKPVGAELKAICLKCLDKTPCKRFGSAGELAVNLKKYLNYESTGVTLPRPWTRLARWVRRQPRRP